MEENKRESWSALFSDRESCGTTWSAMSHAETGAVTRKATEEESVTQLLSIECELLPNMSGIGSGAVICFACYCLIDVETVASKGVQSSEAESGCGYRARTPLNFSIILLECSMGTDRHQLPSSYFMASFRLNMLRN